MSARRQFSSHQLLVADGVLLGCAALFGSSFIGMKLGMSYIGPFTFNCAKLILGVLLLLPFRSRISAVEQGETATLLSPDRSNSKRKRGSGSGVIPHPGQPERSSFSLSPQLQHHHQQYGKPKEGHNLRQLVIGGLLVGFAMFAGTSLQQLGIVYTTAGKTGFITGFYVPLTAVFAWLGGGRTSGITCISVAISMCGLYLLSVEPHSNFTFGVGETLVAFAAVWMAVDVFCTDWLLEKWDLDPTMFSLANHVWASLFAIILALFVEGPEELKELNGAKWAIIFTGVVDVLGYTFSAIGQQKAPPTHAALLLCLEGPIAMFCGWMAFGETLTFREGIGAIIMLTAAIMSQISNVCGRSDEIPPLVSLSV